MRAEADDDARLLDAGVRERLAVAAADIHLPQESRLTEWQRATVSALVTKSIRTVEDELRTSLMEAPALRGHEALQAALTSAHVPIAAPLLERYGKHADPTLVAALIRRADEHRRARTRGATETALLGELIRGPDEEIAEEAMAILIAHSRRFDRLSEPVVARVELTAEVEHRLVWRVAAALRLYMVREHGVRPAAADHAIVVAAEMLLARYDEGDGLDARCVRLVRRLRDAERLDDAMIARSLAEGPLPLFLAAISARASLSHGAAWEIIFDPRGRGAALLLRAARIGRTEAGSILLDLALDEEEAAAQLDRFDVTSPTAAEEALRLWRMDMSYREALAEIAA